MFWFLSAHAPRGPGASNGQPDPPRGWRPGLTARAGMTCGARRGVGPLPEEDRPRRAGGAAPRRGQRVEPACLRPAPRARGEGPPRRCLSSPIRSPAFWPSQRGADVGGRGGGPGVHAVPPPKKQKQKKRAPAGAGGGGRATASKKKNEKHSPRRPPPRALPPRPHASHPSSPRTVRVAVWVTGVGFMREAIVMRWGRGGKREGKGSKTTESEGGGGEVDLSALLLLISKGGLSGSHTHTRHGPPQPHTRPRAPFWNARAPPGGWAGAAGRQGGSDTHAHTHTPTNAPPPPPRSLPLSLHAPLPPSSLFPLSCAAAAGTRRWSQRWPRS